MNYIDELQKALDYGFINENADALELYKPRLLINDFERGEKVLNALCNELRRCDEFLFSVAFITESGVTALLNILSDLEKSGVKGKIIASQYQNFTQPKALEKLISLSNIDLRIVAEETAKMHTKGYIFRKGTEYTIIVGSSNLTQEALCKNKEWNVKLSSSRAGDLLKNTLAEFEYLFNIATKVDGVWIQQYKKIYREHNSVNKNAVEILEEKIFKIREIQPNKMQVKALQNIDLIREEGEQRSLVISATGTGKTFLAAFDVRKVNPNRFLFVIHREQIAKEALRSFQKVMGYEKSMAMLTGYSKNTKSDYIFSTIQTLSKDEILHSFKPDDFDYIVIDEVHRSGAESYQKIINYFKPKFLLGMSATPERTDGFDVFKLFNHCVAYEIRLQEAMKEDMICPFHYFGVTELSIDGDLIDDNTEFRFLTSDERVKHIIEKANFYGFNGEKVKGLIFCSRKDEARELSDKFNQNGYRTIALSGENSQQEREDAIDALESGALQYIFTVDIFNEGVDIPKINQIIMLRPTQSAIIFVQQLGRGLRLNPDKEFVVVIDFIGNYQKNFLIPIALSGDNSFNKDTIRKYAIEGNRVIPGCSTINFDSIAREKIFASIDAANFNDIKLIKESYSMLKQKLGMIPTLYDFVKYNAIDVERIFDKCGSYHNFLTKYETDYKIEIGEDEKEVIEFVSKKFANGKRPHELELLKIVIDNRTNVLGELEKVLKNKYTIEITEQTVRNLINQFSHNFATGTSKDSYPNAVFIEGAGKNFKVSRSFGEMLKNLDFLKMINESIEYGLSRYSENYFKRYNDTNLVLYQKYTYADVCRCLDWEKEEVALNIGGYKYDEKTKTYPVFINYNKDGDIQDTIKYEDRFTSPSTLVAISKAKRTIDSQDVQNAMNARELGIQMHLFVRKNKDDKISKEFYYLGQMFVHGQPQEFTMKNTTSTAVEIPYQLETPVRQDIYDFLTDGE